jgi:excisionase family DNA binding protein
MNRSASEKIRRMNDEILAERLLRGAEVAEIIGCSRAMAYRLMQRETIPVVKIPGGKTVRVPLAALLAWVKENTRMAAA